jgi:L-arabonate dehydrase
MLNGKYRGQELGSGTGVWRFNEELKAGTLSQQDFMEAEACMSRSAGHCMTMGTASTMACMVEALGLALPHNAAIPAVDSRRYVLAHTAGRRIVEMVRDDLRMSRILTRPAFENAMVVNGAVGGSTNAVIHLLAIAGRVGLKLTLDDWDRLGRDVPTLVDLMPSGRFLMEDFYYAGGLPAVIRALGERNLIHRDALTVNGKTIWENCQAAPNWNPEVIRPLEKPLVEHGGIAVLRGNLAPDGAVLKPSAASPHLMRHRGRAVVFENIEHYKQRIDNPDLEVDETCILVFKNCGPKGYPGMAEVGNMSLPAKLLQRGITDMVRISDARMSGTAYGTVVSPRLSRSRGRRESCPGAGRRLHRIKRGIPHPCTWKCRQPIWIGRAHKVAAAPVSPMKGGYQQLYVERVMQANTGADLDFLTGCRGDDVPRESH